VNSTREEAEKMGLDEVLFRRSPTDPGDQYQSHLLEPYKPVKRKLDFREFIFHVLR
jgi:hypothetical protein